MTTEPGIKGPDVRIGPVNETSARSQVEREMNTFGAQYAPSRIYRLTN